MGYLQVNIYEYILIHADYLMVDIRRVEKVMQAIINTHRLKKDNETGLTYVPSDTYLGAQIGRY